MSKTAEKIPELKHEHEENEHHSEAPKPGHSDVDTLRQAKSDQAKADEKQQQVRVPKRTDSSNRSFGT